MQETSMQRFNKLGEEVNEEILLNEIVDARTPGLTNRRWTADNGPSPKLTLRALSSSELTKHFILQRN